MKLVENAVVAGRFRLNHLIQRGGMGSVWHATHLGLDIPCALKFVKGELLDNEDVMSRFEREAKAAAQLRSPNVVQILDHGVCDGTPYIAMELLDGEDLEVRLERVGQLVPQELHKIINEVCRALSKAHALGVVHRDLKPANIYLVKDVDNEITKVLDFGIAKTRPNELTGSATKTGAMLGTPYYMSPEQAQGTKTVDFRSDLWSLAVIAYQCLTGQLPFVSEALGDLLMKIMVAPIPVPSQVASVPPGFDKWWAKAASRDAADRFQSAKEFSDSLALVCGISQVSSVIDRSRLHIHPESTQGRPATAPIELTRPTPGPLPPSAPQAIPGVTPAPMSRSVGGEALPPPPGMGVGAKVALAFGGLVFITLLSGVGWFISSARKPAPTASDTSATSAPPAAPASSTATTREPAPASAATAPPSTASAAAAAPTPTPVPAHLPTSQPAHLPTPTPAAVVTQTKASPSRVAGPLPQPGPASPASKPANTDSVKGPGF